MASLKVERERLLAREQSDLGLARGARSRR